MGAISPGPSLVVVLRNTIVGGRSRGIMTAIGHGTGFSIYAFVAVMGLSSVLLANKQLFNLLQVLGALVLIWLAFFNPKILVFLVAIFSQFINSDITNSDRFIMAIIAGIIDTIWYVLVATALAGTNFIDSLRANEVFIDRFIGIILLILTILLFMKILY